ncbi:MarR family winged helix-turn-helix transcriptional regulator [Flavisolibacter nicotianae]|uniref:MarR family winged helix-turn-helix transcriptional regulator n=1 Tax=Flavisolibacter nicotianae TaxID=2364882 RepID=UPI000EB029C3|nr:MarR family winged helix-turn-helix transcriptional regulator [Flavisolibacter nicotianae]
MNQKETDKRLLEFHHQKNQSVGKLISHIKRHFDAWAMSEFCEHGYADFKMGYMPLIMNIHPEGITNNELAKKARVTKQAMSKVVKELAEAHYIATEPDGKDKRSSIIYLTPKGKKLVLSAKERVLSLEKEYEQVLGKKGLAQFKEMLNKLIEYHDEKKSCDF